MDKMTNDKSRPSSLAVMNMIIWGFLSFSQNFEERAQRVSIIKALFKNVACLPLVVLHTHIHNYTNYEKKERELW